MTLRKRLALALCRAAGLTEVASTREELDAMRTEHRKLTKAYSAHISLVQTMAKQLNTNTRMMQRWHESSPALQAIEKAYARKKSRLILPPTADLRTIITAD